tara:strand:- start:135 stop:830 length:696 start_codon:yes stop_codon:yes gene_type:complete
MHFFYSTDIKDDSIMLDGQEMIHCIKVLRKKNNDFIYVTNGNGNLFKCKIIDSSSNQSKLSIVSKKTNKRNIKTHLLIAPTKNHKRIEWMVEKTVEIGIDRITFLICKNSIRRTVNLDRLNKIALSAMKQTMSTFLPQMDECTIFDKAITSIDSKEKYVAHLQDHKIQFLPKLIRNETSRCILIGPEGDFDKNEIDYSLTHGFVEVSLGSSRLRTETAGIVSMTMLNSGNE